MKPLKKVNRIIAVNSILHDRINDRAKYPLSNKFFFKERLQLDAKLREETRGY